MTDISKPGVHDIPLDEQDVAEQRYKELRLLGHAITMDHTFNSMAKIEIIRVHHYRTCIMCEVPHGQSAKPL